MICENGIHSWKYKAQYSFDEGYKEANKQLEKYTSDLYNSKDEKGKEELIDEVFNIYRKTNIFPIYYYSHTDIIEEIQYCQEKDFPKFNGEILDKKPTLGNSMLKFLFPNFYLVDCKDQKDNCLYNRFFDDHILKRTIKFCFEFKSATKYPCQTSGIRGGLEMVGGNIPLNYLPMKVRMLLDYYLPEGGNYLDYSCGFGGRLLGSQTVKSKNVSYFGFEPQKETYAHLLELKSYIKEALNLNTTVNIYNQGSEETLPSELENNIDFAFSCPPYFNLEKYSLEETQCYIKYPTIESWLNGYVKNTIKNIYKALKKDCYYSVNIADFKINNELVQFVDKWIEISKECGFEFVKVIPAKLGKSRPNNISNKQCYVPKIEGIYLFKK